VTNGPRRRVFRIPFSRRALWNDVDTELQFHIEGRIEELMSKGLSRGEAERRARERFGNLERIESEVETIDRATRRRQSLRERGAAVVFDVRYALRGMGRRPLYTTIVILTLALGIGANTAIFSLVNAVLMHPVPTPALDQLVVIEEDLLPLNLLGAELSPGEVLDLAKRKDLFVATAAHAHGSANLTGQGEPQRVSTLRTMGNYFGLFGVRPYLGHFYRAEDSADPASAVVASYGFWQQVLGADPRAVGRSLELNGYKYEIAGVLPADVQ